MKVGKRRRVNLLADDVVWRRFKVLCLESGQDVEQRLGELVAGDVRTGARRKTVAEKRRETKAKELRTAIREAELSTSSSTPPKPARGARRRRSSKP